MTSAHFPRHFLLPVTFLFAAGLMQAAPTITVTQPTTMNFVRGKGTGTGLVGAAPKITVTISNTVALGGAATDSLYVAIDTTTLPYWAVADKANISFTGLTASAVFTLSPSPLAANLAPGQYTQNIEISVVKTTAAGVKTTYDNGTTPAVADARAVINIKNPPSQIAATSTSPLSWSYGSGTLPTATVLVSSVDGDPLGFTVTTAGTSPTGSWVSASPATGIAYATPETVTLAFAQSTFDNAVKGTPITFSVTVKGPNNTVVIPVTINVTSPGTPPAFDSTVPFIPAKLPVLTGGTGVRTVAVQGTDFFVGMVVKIGSTTIANNCATFATITAAQALCIQSENRLFLKIKESDLAVAGNVTIDLEGVTATIPITASPIVYGVANSASLVETAPGADVIVAPYEMITITGENLSASSVVATIAAARYPIKLTDSAPKDIKVTFTDPDFGTGAAATAAASDATTIAVTVSNGGTGYNVAPKVTLGSIGTCVIASATATVAAGAVTAVTVVTSACTGTETPTVTFSSAHLLDGDAYLVSATPTQIVAMVPSSVADGDTAVVDYGGAKSDPITFDVVSAVPGVFAGEDGTAIAINNETGLQNSSVNSAAKSKDVTVYLTGMGAPNSTADPAAGDNSALTGFAACTAIGKYMTAANAAWLTVDGAVLDKTKVNGGANNTTLTAPCIDPADVVVTIGTSADANKLTLTTTDIKRAGWVDGEVTGLYAITFTLPATGTYPTKSTIITGAYDISATIGGKTTQTGTAIWIK